MKRGARRDGPRVRRLKRLLRPLRPVLAPAWHGLLRATDRDATVSVWTVAERAKHAAIAATARLARRPPRRIRALRRYELLALADRIPYYERRVDYMSVAGQAVDRLIARHRLSTALELGPNLRPLVVGADTMELAVKPEMEAEGRRIIHDATVVPWPIADKAYDLFVGLQVFEHLGTCQPEAFLEVRRVARHAVLSLPIDWKLKDPSNVHHGITHEHVLGWFAPVHPTAVLVGNPGGKKRLVYVFEDLPAPGEASAEVPPEG